MAHSVTETSGGDEQQPVRQGIAAEHPLDGAVAGMQAALDRRDRHVHDRGVEQDHEGTDEDHAKDQHSVWDIRERVVSDARLIPARIGLAQHSSFVPDTSSPGRRH